MSAGLQSPIDSLGAQDSNYVTDTLVERLWNELEGTVPREQIYRVALTAALEFRDATVQAYLPILIYRRTLQKLRPPSEE